MDSLFLFAGNERVRLYLAIGQERNREVTLTNLSCKQITQRREEREREREREPSLSLVVVVDELLDRHETITHQQTKCRRRVAIVFRQKNAKF